MGTLEEGMAAFDQDDYGTAYRCLLPWAKSGNPVAQCRIALLYQAGWGVEPNGILAVHWYRKAAEQRSLEGNISGLAYHNLGTIYVAGLPGVEPDRELAKQYRMNAREFGVCLVSD